MDRIENCPKCDQPLTYEKDYIGSQAICGNNHVWVVYKAHNGLVLKDGPPKTMTLPYSEAMSMFNLGAEIWNALVWYSDSMSGKFWGRLLDIAIRLRDRAHEEHPDDENYKTQMDFEVERMKRDGHRPWSEREDGKSIRVKL